MDGSTSSIKKKEFEGHYASHTKRGLFRKNYNVYCFPLKGWPFVFITAEHEADSNCPYRYLAPFPAIGPSKINAQGLRTGAERRATLMHALRVCCVIDYFYSHVTERDTAVGGDALFTPDVSAFRRWHYVTNRCVCVPSGYPTDGVG